MRFCPDAPKLDLEELHEPLGAQGAPVAKVAGMDVRELLDEDEEFLVAERIEVDDGRKHVREPLAREAPLGEAAAERLVGVDATAAVLDGLWRTTHDEADVVGLALEGVVVHREDLLVVVLTRDGVRDLVEVYELVDEDEHALVARALEELGKELEVVVPVVVRDADVDAKLLAGLGLGSILAAKPAEHGAATLVVAVDGGVVVGAHDACKVKAVNHLLEGSHGLSECLGVIDLAGRGAAAHVGHPAVEYELERAALGTRLGREVADELAVGGEPLPGRSLEPALGGEVCVCHDESLAHGVRADGLEQEALASAVAAYEEAEACAAVRDEVKVMEERRNLGLAAHGDVGQPDSGDDAALERVDENRGDSFGNAGVRGGLWGHGRRAPLTSCW